MKRKIILGSLLVFINISLLGCGNQIPELSEEQSVLVTEYAAGVLLKYDTSQKSKLMTEQEMAEFEAEMKEIQEQAAEREKKKQEKEKQEDTKNSVSGNSSDSKTSAQAEPYTIADLTAFLELEGISMEYKEYVLCDSYTPEEGEIALEMPASPGMELMVLKFDLKNNTENDFECNILSKDVRFRIQIGDKWKPSLLTMLSDELSTLNTMIPSGESIQSVLIIEVLPGEAEGMEEFPMLVRYNGESMTINLTK